MSLSVNNSTSLSIMSTMNRNQTDMTTSMTRLGTSLRINSSQDDASGLQIASGLNSQSRGMVVAQKNAQSGISLLQLGDASLAKAGDMIMRMKELVTEGLTVGPKESKTALQAEFSSLGKALNNIMNNTRGVGGDKLLVGGTLSRALSFQIGGTAEETMKVDFSTQIADVDAALKKASGDYNGITADAAKMNAVKTAQDTYDKSAALANAEKDGGWPSYIKGAGTLLANWQKAVDDKAALDASKPDPVKDKAAIEAANKNVTDTRALADANKLSKQAATDADSLATAKTAAGIKKDEVTDSTVLDQLTNALSSLNAVRAQFGANANSLQHTMENLENVNNSTKVAMNRIMDVDFAKESANVTAKQIASQAATSMFKKNDNLNSSLISMLLQ